jgi:HAD superfamily hydrolase (TIGR01509 family)
MKTILVDAVNTLVIQEVDAYKIFWPMFHMLELLPNRKVVLTNADDRKIKLFGLDDIPYKVFTLSGNPSKLSPLYYETFLAKYNLDADEVVYFEHSLPAVEIARSIGINVYHYDHVISDIRALYNFLISNSA